MQLLIHTQMLISRDVASQTMQLDGTTSLIRKHMWAVDYRTAPLSMTSLNDLFTNSLTQRIDRTSGREIVLRFLVICAFVRDKATSFAINVQTRTVRKRFECFQAITAAQHQSSDLSFVSCNNILYSYFIPQILPHQKAKVHRQLNQLYAPRECRSDG